MFDASTPPAMKKAKKMSDLGNPPKIDGKGNFPGKFKIIDSKNGKAVQFFE